MIIFILFFYFSSHLINLTHNNDTADVSWHTITPGHVIHICFNNYIESRKDICGSYCNNQYISCESSCMAVQ